MPARMVPSATILLLLLLLLLVAHFAMCMKPRKEDMEACTKEAADRSSVSEEDKTKALEIMQQTKRDMHRMFRERNKEALKEMRKKEFLSGKLQASEDIKDKQAAVKFATTFSYCLMAKFISWERIHCQKAKDVNQDRLSDDDLKKVLITAKEAKMEKEGKIADEELEKKFVEVLESEEKAKVAMQVEQALEECKAQWKANKAARKTQKSEE